jgi:hypothetical protein
MATSLSTPAAVEARRTDLFRAEAAGAVVTEADWDEVAAAQRALDDAVFAPSGYIRGLL